MKNKKKEELKGKLEGKLEEELEAKLDDEFEEELGKESEEGPEEESEEYELIPIETSYIEPNESLDKIIDPAIAILKDDDYLVIAETPIAISQGRIIDETDYEPGLIAKFLAIVWSKYIWGYILGPVLGIKERTIKNLRKLPEESKRHKEVVLKLYGLKHALKPASEAGIDLSNAPGTYVSLLPENPEKVAKEISKEINKRSNKRSDKQINVKVLIIDTDATYKMGNSYFTGLPVAIDGISSDNGVLAYVLGQLFENAGSTPLGASWELSVEEGLKIANIAEDYQRSLATNMETIHSVKKVLKTNTNLVTIEQLNSITHTPAIIIRKK